MAFTSCAEGIGARDAQRGGSPAGRYPAPQLHQVHQATTYEDTQRAWLKLCARADRGSVASNVPTLHEYLVYWLSEVVKPNLAPNQPGGALGGTRTPSLLIRSCIPPVQPVRLRPSGQFRSCAQSCL